MRATLAVLLIALCAGAVVAHPADILPTEHWAYGSSDELLAEMPAMPMQNHSFTGLRTRFEIAEITLAAIHRIRGGVGGIDPVDVTRLRAIWRKLAEEFLPDILIMGEPVVYLQPYPVDHLWPREVPDEALPVNLAIRDLRAVPHDHWLYPEAQRVLWAAAGMEYTDAPGVEDVTPADTVPLDHWAYQAIVRLLPVAFPDQDATFFRDRALTRYEFAVVAGASLRDLLKVEQPTPELEDLALTWALLALEFWPELEDLAEDVAFIRHERVDRPEERGSQYPLLHKGQEITADHWLSPTVTRVLEIAGRND